MPAKLATYRSKRDPKKTPEPMGSPAPKKRATKKPRPPIFVIQEHHARALHWDLRLERDGVLVSWALPKGLPESPKTNHLAVHTEDHPMEYADFEGEIPKGEYGGGHVTIWDRGTYDLEKWSSREVKFVLKGTRASGLYVLFQTGGKNWMIHRMDPAPADYVPMPDWIDPMLALAGALPKTDKGWSYEFKWDGVRAIVFVEGGRVRALSRNEKDFVSVFPELRAVGDFLGSRSAILDGEIVSLDDEGRPSFGRLQQRLNISSQSLVTKRARDYPASYLVFDLLYLEGELLLDRAYDERRRLLESLKLEGDWFATPPAFHDQRGADVLRVAGERGLEGVVIKRRQSVYSPGKRNGDWIKVKRIRTQEVVIGGWTAGKGARLSSFGALLLGLPGRRGLDYIGKVGTGFSDATQKELLERFAPLAVDESPFAQQIPPADRPVAHFLRPTLVGEVQFSEWTKDGHLRQPSWRGLRPDKDGDEVVRES